MSPRRRLHDNDAGSTAGTAGASGTAGGAGGPGGADPPYSPFRQPSRWPAIFVVAIAALIVLGGIVASALTAPPPANAPASNQKAPHGPQAATQESTAQLLRPISSLGQPPSDVLSALEFPAGTVVFAAANQDHGSGLYDHSAALCAPGKPASTANFLLAHLPRDAWTILAQVKLAHIGQSVPLAALLHAADLRSPHTTPTAFSSNRGRYAFAVLSSTSASPGTEIIAKHASEDGYYWEVGIVVADTSAPVRSVRSVRSASCTELLLNLFELHVAM